MAWVSVFGGGRGGGDGDLSRSDPLPDSASLDNIPTPVLMPSAATTGKDDWIDLDQATGLNSEPSQGSREGKGGYERVRSSSADSRTGNSLLPVSRTPLR